jgi:hypothetical protein
MSRTLSPRTLVDADSPLVLSVRLFGSVEMLPTRGGAWLEMIRTFPRVHCAPTRTPAI